MASSVARLPGDEWRDPARAAAAVFGARLQPPSFSSAANLKKVLVRPTSSSSSSSAAADDGDAPDSSSSARRRHHQSQILDRWAARQAREMITTIERQAHEAELSALSSSLQPVSARAASFLREPSPSSSESSFASSSAGTAGGGVDLPNVRASSLIQMWRELEAEACPSPTPRAAAAAAAAAASNNSASAHRASSPEHSDDSEAFGDWDSETTGTASSSLTESEGGRVGSIVKMLSLGRKRTQRAESEGSVVSSADQREGFGTLVGSLVRVRSRREMEDLVVKMERERRREIDALAERQPVSRFPHRGRIQVN